MRGVAFREGLSRTAWDFRNSQAVARGPGTEQVSQPNSLGFQEQSGGASPCASWGVSQPNSLGFQEQSGGPGTPEPTPFTPSRTAWDFRNSQAVHSKNRPRLPLLGRTAWDFRNSQAGAKSESKRRKQLAEQLGISGTVRRAVRICSSVASSGRTAWDFRNSQAAGVLGNIPQTEGPNSLGFQEQSGGVERMRSFISRAPNSLGFQEQSGGLKDSRHSLQSSAEQLGISGTVRRKFASAASMLSPSPNSLGFQEQSGGSKAKEYRPRQ